jgi:hypothetical protein
MVDGLVNEIARGSSPFRKAECGSAGDQGFQVGVLYLHASGAHMHARSATAPIALHIQQHQMQGSASDIKCV